MKFSKTVLCSLILVLPLLVFPRLILAESWMHTVIQTNKLNNFQIEWPMDYSGFSFDGCTGGDSGKSGKWYGNRCKIGLRVTAGSSHPSYVYLDIHPKSEHETDCTLTLGVVLDHGRKDPNGYKEEILSENGDGCIGRYQNIALKEISKDRYQLVIHES